MPPKEVPRKKKGGDNEQLKSEQPLQAVLLADSFTKTFMPLSLNTPKVAMTCATACGTPHNR